MAAAITAASRRARHRLVGRLQRLLGRLGVLTPGEQVRVDAERDVRVGVAELA